MKLKQVEGDAYMTVDKPSRDAKESLFPNEFKKILKRDLKNNPNVNFLNPCLFPLCDKAEISQGLCAKHYQHARRLVTNGSTTWDELYQKGKARKKLSQTTNWFLNK